MEERVEFLIAQRRYKMAYDLLKEELVSRPDEPRLLSLLATCSLYLNKKDEALDLTSELIRMEPWNPYHFYLRANVFLSKNKMQDAHQLLSEAIAIDPNNNVYYELEARILYHKKEFVQAERAAQMSLSLDAQNIDAVNILARIYNAQNKREESERLMSKVLDLDPENVDTHTNYGMQFLEKGQVPKAMEHFSQALRKEPNNQYAQHGMKLAMKAKFPLYRWLLQFQLFMAKQSQQTNFIVIIGIVIITQSIGRLSEVIGGIAVPLGYTIVALLVLFVLSSWILDSIMTFVLSTQKMGRLALDERELKLAKFTGIQLLLIALGLLGMIVNLTYLHIAGIGFLGLLTSQRLIVEENSKGRKIALVFYSGGALLFIAAIVTSLVGSNDMMNQLSLMAILSCAAYTWVGNSWGRG